MPLDARVYRPTQLVSGAEKAPMVGRALSGIVDPKAIPAQLARRATWILDQAAAAHLSL